MSFLPFLLLAAGIEIVKVSRKHTSLINHLLYQKQAMHEALSVHYYMEENRLNTIWITKQL